MPPKVTKIDVWSGEIQDQPGGLAGVLRQLAGASANLEMVVARRQPDKPGTGIVFLAPVKGRKITEAAAVAGVSPATRVAALRVEGTDRPGLGAKMTGAIADASINLRGLSAAVLGSRFVDYMAFLRKALSLDAVSDMQLDELKVVVNGKGNPGDVEFRFRGEPQEGLRELLIERYGWG